MLRDLQDFDQIRVTESQALFTAYRGKNIQAISSGVSPPIPLWGLTSL